MGRRVSHFAMKHSHRVSLCLTGRSVLNSVTRVAVLRDVNLLASSRLGMLLSRLGGVCTSTRGKRFIVRSKVRSMRSRIRLVLAHQLNSINGGVRDKHSHGSRILISLGLFAHTRLGGLTRSMRRLFQILVTRDGHCGSILVPNCARLRVTVPSSFNL